MSPIQYLHRCATARSLYTRLAYTGHSHASLLITSGPRPGIYHSRQIQSWKWEAGLREAEAKCIRVPSCSISTMFLLVLSLWAKWQMLSSAERDVSLISNLGEDWQAISLQFHRPRESRLCEMWHISKEEATTFDLTISDRFSNRTHYGRTMVVVGAL